MGLSIPETQMIMSLLDMNHVVLEVIDPSAKVMVLYL